MNVLMNILLAVQMLSALGMIGLILMQHGKGADAGAAFGGGGSASLFGASGSANFLSRTTAILATLFLACTLGLSYVGHHRAPATGTSVLEGAPVPVEAPAGTAPAQPAAPATAPGAPQIPAQ